MKLEWTIQAAVGSFTVRAAEEHNNNSVGHVSVLRWNHVYAMCTAQLCEIQYCNACNAHKLAVADKSRSQMARAMCAHIQQETGSNQLARSCAQRVNAMCG